MSLTGIYRVAVREWHLMINSRKSRVIILWVPLVVFTLLAGIYSAGVLREVPGGAGSGSLEAFENHDLVY